MRVICTQLVCQYSGILVTYGFLLLFDIPANAQVMWVELLCIIVYFPVCVFMHATYAIAYVLQWVHVVPVYGICYVLISLTANTDIVAMFLLRTSVMNNNAQISCFPVKYLTGWCLCVCLCVCVCVCVFLFFDHLFKYRVRLSLLNNLIGFVVNFGGLLILRYAPLNVPASWGLNTELWWVCSIYCCYCRRSL